MIDSELIDKVEAFGQSLAKKRAEAVNARKNSGIEQEWTEAEEAYQGIDDANRGIAGKPSSPNGGFVNTTVISGTRSTVYLNITRPYVDAASARVGDMLLPTDDTPWAIKHTPIADVHSEQQQEIEQINAQAKQAAEGAMQQIEDWLVQCQWHAEVRKMIENCARLGTGVLKGPTPTKYRNRVSKRDGGMLQIVIEEKIAPETRSISPWCLYPDPACGNDMHRGAYIWERDLISAKKLRDLKGMDYLDDQIDKVLEQGPSGKHEDSGFVGKKTESDMFEIWYYHGIAERDDLEAAGVDIPEEGDVSVSCLVTMVNNVVIKAALNPLDTGDFPYDMMPWQRRDDSPWGIGVAKQINTPQRMLNAATRNMMDNAGLSAGPQLIVRRNAITPADGSWSITPRKIWWVAEGADVASVNQAFMAINIPTLQNELMGVIQFALKMAEDVTGMPMLMQGQSGSAPETVGGMQLVDKNASTVLRRIARNFDDYVTEPHIRRYYDWLLMYGDDDSIKGDFQIDARGSTAMVERDIQNQAIMQMGQLVMNPAFGVDPEKWFKEALKAQRLDPERFTLDEDKKAQMAQPAPPPVIQAAQIRAQADMQKAQFLAQADAQKTQALTQVEMQKLQLQLQAKSMEVQAGNQVDMEIAGMQNQASVQKMQLDTDRDRVYVEAQMSRDQSNAQAKLAELTIKRELAMLEYSLREKLSLEQVKAKLADSAMKLNVTKELAGLKASADMLPTPLIEPAGRAPAGESYQK